MLDTGNSSYDKDNPLATPYEYVAITANNTGTNTLTITRGQASTTAKAFFAGATIACALLAEDLVAGVPWTIDVQTPTSGSVITIPASGSIPASYLGTTWSTIRVEWAVRTTSGNNFDSLSGQFNGDSGAHYNYELRDTVATNVTAGTTANATSILAGTVAGGALAAVYQNSGWLDIFNYANTTWVKKGFCWCMRNDIGGFGMRESGWEWAPTVQAAITSIALTISAGAYATGCRFTTRLLP